MEARSERIQSTRWVNIRRSQRVILRLPVTVRASRGAGPIVETTHTLVVNEHGALLMLSMEVQLKEVLSIENLVNGKQQFCKVVHREAQGNQTYEVGIAFSEPAYRFWNVHFPAQLREATQ